MPELPKWVTDNLTQTPILAAVVIAVVGVVRWLDGKHRRDLARHERAAADELRRVEGQYRERLEEKDRRIRSLEREVRQLRRKQ